MILLTNKARAGRETLTVHANDLTMYSIWKFFLLTINKKQKCSPKKPILYYFSLWKLDINFTHKREMQASFNGVTKLPSYFLVTN